MFFCGGSRTPTGSALVLILLRHCFCLQGGGVGGETDLNQHGTADAGGSYLVETY